MRRLSFSKSLAFRLLFCLALLAPLACQAVSGSTESTPTPTDTEVVPATESAPTEDLSPVLTLPSDLSPTAEFPVPTLPGSLPPLPTIDDQFIYQETFDTVPTNWGIGKDDNEFMTLDLEVVNGGYSWDIKAKQDAVHLEHSVPPVLLPDDSFVYRATVSIQNGPSDAAYGLLFRLQDADNFYYFEVLQNGFYSILAQENNKWVILVPKTPTTDLRKLSNDYDQIYVKGNGSHYEFYINDQLQTTLDDARFKGGTIGLAAELFKANDTATLIFDDLTVCSTAC